MSSYRKSMREAREEMLVISEAKYELYHKDFSSAMQHAYKMAKKLHGITINPDEISDKVATGPRKPSEGKTNKYRLEGDKGGIQIQVYNKGGSKPFELNMYKEEVELDEALKPMSDSELTGMYHSAIKWMERGMSQKEALKKLAKEMGVTRKETAAVKKKLDNAGFKEEVELDEAKMSSSQIAMLKKAYEPMRDKKIGVENADRLSKMMNKIAGDKEALMQLFKADIPFVSQSAVTKLISKHGMKGAEINKLREGHEINEVLPFVVGAAARLAAPIITRKLASTALGTGARKLATGAVRTAARHAGTAATMGAAPAAGAAAEPAASPSDDAQQKRDSARAQAEKQRAAERAAQQDAAQRKAAAYSMTGVDEGLIDSMLSLFGKGKKPEGKLLGGSKAASRLIKRAKKSQADRDEKEKKNEKYESEYESQLTEASAYSDARRAMASDPSTRQKFSKNISASDDDIKSADKNIIMQLRDVVSLKGVGKLTLKPSEEKKLKKSGSGYTKTAGSGFVEFANGRKEKVDLKIAQAILDKYNKQRKPSDKERFQAKISKSKKDMLKALKETNQIDKNRTSLSKVKNFMKENEEK